MSAALYCFAPRLNRDSPDINFRRQCYACHSGTICPPVDQLARKLLSPFMSSRQHGYRIGIQGISGLRAESAGNLGSKFIKVSLLFASEIHFWTPIQAILHRVKS